MKKDTIFARRLIELRLENGISQQELANFIGFGKTIVYYWEKGEREPTSQALTCLSKYFNVSVDYLLGLEDDFGNISANNNAGLTENEKRLLKAFNTLDDIEQEKLIEDAEFYANRSSKSSKSIKNV